MNMKAEKEILSIVKTGSIVTPQQEDEFLFPYPMMMDPDVNVPSCFWHPGEMGIVLEVLNSDKNHSYSKAKIVTAKGLGWIYLDYLDILF